MAQQWPSSQADSRTFGAQIARTLDDLNRPQLQGIATSYLQDSMRFWQRKPFFFTDAVNSDPLQWQTAVNVVRGTTIQFLSGTTTYAFVAANEGITGTTEPNFASVVGTPFVAPGVPGNPPTLPPPVAGTAGTIIDNNITWLNNGPIIGGFHANPQLSTVYNTNEYDLPVDLVAFTRVEITWATTIRIELAPLAYSELRDFDMIRPTPPTTYPTTYAYYRQKLYIWPYPVAQYPLTISYRSAPPIAQNANESNIWTTQAEAMVRHYAEGRINEAVIGDQQMAQLCFDLANQEFLDLQQQTSQRDVRAGIPPSDW